MQKKARIRNIHQQEIYFTNLTVFVMSRFHIVRISVLVVLSLMLHACGDNTETKTEERLVEYVDDQSGDENFTANIITPPADADSQFVRPKAPVVEGTTSKETNQTEINNLNQYVVNDSLRLIEGTLNHTRNSSLIVADFKADSGIALVPILRSTGQFSMERTTRSSDVAIDSGKNVILAVNGDQFDIVNGWNGGLVKVDGLTYIGFNDNIENIVVVYNDGRLDIVEKPPAFTLNAYVSNKLAGEVGSTFYYDVAQQQNLSFSRGAASPISVYSAENYRGVVDLTGKSAVLVRPQANGVSVIARRDGMNSVQFAPFSGDVVATVGNRNDYVIPAGHALIVGLTEAAVGSRIDLRYETKDANWNNVRYAIGAGFGRGLLVDNGKPAADVDEAEISGRTALGIRADGSAFFLVADKPVGSIGDGITRRKLGQLMMAYGAVKAINFDGGGSTTMVNRLPGEHYTRVLNKPSDGNERSVANKWALVLDPGRAKYPESVAVYPRELTVLAGSIYRRFRGVGYDGSTWQRDGKEVEFGMSTADIGLIDKVTGAFKAGNHDAEGYVVVRVGEKKGLAKVRVVSKIDSVKFSRDVYSVDSGGTLVLRPTLESGGVPVTYESGVLRYSLDNTSDCRFDPASGVLKVTNVQGRSCTLTTTVGSVSASAKVNIGVPPVVIEDFEGNVSAYSAAGARFKSVNLTKVGNPTFAGNGSMQLSWEADPGQPGTFGAYFNDPKMSKTIPGYPKYLGVNVYIPDELAGKVWWVRGLLKDADGKTITINYNNDGDALPSRGWTLMKARIPEGFKEPIRFSQPFRFLVLKTAERIDSRVVLDNFTAIYSEKTDLQGPSVSISPANSTVVSTRNPQISLQVFDSSGVDFSDFELLLDNVSVNGKAKTNKTDRIDFQPTVALQDGWHRIDYRVKDVNGNVSSGDLMFNVVTDSPRIFVDAKIPEFYPGGTFDLPLRVVNGANFKSLALRLGFDATKVSMEVIPADLTPSNVVMRPGAWEGNFSGFGGGTQVAAILRLKVKDYILNTDVSVTVDGALDGKTFYHPVVRKPVGGRYSLKTTWGVGGRSTKVLVTLGDGRPAAGVKVEMLKYDSATDTVSGVTLLGTTDAQGLLEVTLPTASGTEELIFRAYDNAGSSLITKVQSLIDDLGSIPKYAFLTPGSETSSINVSWFTGLDAQSSVVRFGVNGALNSVVEGTSEVVPFLYGSEARVVRIHHAKMSGLQPGTAYGYSVGDGSQQVSPVYTFKTDNRDDAVDILLFGDTQTLSNENIFNGSGLVNELYRKMQAQLPGGELIMHVGDITDDITDFRLQRLFFDAMQGEGKLASKIFVPTQGNHEVLNEGATKFASFFPVPYAAGSTATPYDHANYSFDYGNMHVAVISSEPPGKSDWESMMRWLEADMIASTKTWKILMLHRPPYNGNPASGNDRSATYVPPIVDRAGIDLVISGHDHMYSRTLPLKGGVPTAGGATYLTAGSDSAKYYDNDGGGVARIADVLFDENVNTYTTLSIRGDRMTVLTRTLDGRIVDDATLRSRSVLAH
ncbi:phosphodiester glycosidase family protein [Cupriavidus basilensis]